MANSPWIVDLGDDDFQTGVVERSYQVPIVLDFWAPWCGPCRTLGPMLEKEAVARNGSFVLAKINVDEAQGLAMQFRIESIPMVVAIDKGKPVLYFQGLISPEELKSFLDRVAGPGTAAPPPPIDPATEEQALRAALAQDDNNFDARLRLAKLLVAKGSFEEVPTLLEPIGAGTGLATEAEQLRKTLELAKRAAALPPVEKLEAALKAAPEEAQTRLQLGIAYAGAERYVEALEMLLSAAQRDSELARGPVKEAMVMIFHVIGIRSDLADEFRDKLQTLLY